MSEKQTVKKALKECENYSGNLMGNIANVLSNNGIEYKTNTKFTEISCSGTKKTILDMLEENLPVPNIVQELLLSVSQSGSNVYIRLKFN